MKRLLPALLFLLSAVPALGAPAISCHCFQDRSFDPGRPAAVDPYLLANAQNSLLAALYGLPKADLVRAKMGGADGDRLWVVHETARAAKVPAELVANVRERTGSWAAALFQLEVDPQRLGDAAADEIRGGGGERELAAAIVDQHLRNRFHVPGEEIAGMRARGAGNREVILASVLARIDGRSPAAVLASVRSGERSWGEWGDELGIDPGALEELIRALLAEPAARPADLSGPR